MTILEAMEARHSVRSYRSAPLDAGAAETLRQAIDTCNKEGGLHIQLVTGDPKAFDTWMAHYGKFSGVQHYIALIGPKGDQLDEKLGYYGQRLVLLAQTLGLNTCWVAMTFGKGAAKSRCSIAPGEKLVCVLALGYGTTQGVPHKSKPMEALCQAPAPSAPMVPPGDGSRHAGPHGHEPAKIPDLFGGKPGNGQILGRLLFQSGSGHRQMPF